MRRIGWRNVLAVGTLVVAGGCAQEAEGDRVLGEAPGPGGGGPVVADHWHAAFGIYVCDEFLPPLPEWEDMLGIHTHGDGVVHIHPFVEEASGERATLELFLDGAAVELDDDRLVVEGEAYENGHDCDGEPAVIQVAQWDDARAGGTPDTLQEDTAGIRFRRDGEAFTIAVAPEGTDIPVPESADVLDELGVFDSPSTTTTSTLDA